MKRNIPDSLVAEGHSDFEVLETIGREILRQAGGLPALTEKVPPLIRETIDDVIQTARTGRRTYDELEKTEKTYIGTRVEIFLRAMLNLKKGTRLDLKIGAHEVDIKHTMGNNWMIPQEAINQPCLLVAADETRALCYLGLFVARPEYLSNSINRDTKKSLSAEGFSHIRWLLNAEPYPANFWSTVDPASVDRIFSGRRGNGRVRHLFREVQDRPVSRRVVEAVAQQKDPIRRVRSDGGHGTRDKLATEGIMLLSAEYNGPLAEKLNLQPLKPGEFMSHRVRSLEEAVLGREHGFAVPWPLDT